MPPSRTKFTTGATRADRLSGDGQDDVVLAFRGVRPVLPDSYGGQVRGCLALRESIPHLQPSHLLEAEWRGACAAGGEDSSAIRDRCCPRSHGDESRRHSCREKLPRGRGCHSRRTWPPLPPRGRETCRRPCPRKPVQVGVPAETELAKAETSLSAGPVSTPGKRVDRCSPTRTYSSMISRETTNSIRLSRQAVSTSPGGPPKKTPETKTLVSTTTFTPIVRHGSPQRCRIRAVRQGAHPFAPLPRSHRIPASKVPRSP